MDNYRSHIATNKKLIHNIMKKTFKHFICLFVAILCFGQVWGTVYVIDLPSPTKVDDNYVYTYSTSSEIKVINNEVWIEIPASDFSGTIQIKGSGTNTKRFLYIYKTNGTVKDENRKIDYKTTYQDFSFTASDIKTDDTKYYLVFGTSDDYKIKNEFAKLTVPAPDCTSPEIAWNIEPAGGAIGSSATASVTTTPASQTVTWNSSITSVATVEAGTISFIAPGTTKISAEFTYSGSDYCEQKVSVSKDITVPIDAITPGTNDKVWYYTTAIPSSNPDNGLTYSATKTGNGLYGTKLNSDGYAWFAKAAVAGTLRVGAYYASSNSSEYVVDVYACSSDGTKGDKIGSLTTPHAGGVSSTLDIDADVEGIYIVRSTSNEGVLYFVEFKDATPSCAVTAPGDIEKGEASGGTGKIVLKVEEDGEPEDGDAWYWQSSASGEAKTDEYNAEDGKEVSAAGTYYLRSYNTADDCWSDAKSVTVDAEDLLTTPTATFSNGAYVVNANALNLSTLWSSNSNGTVTYALKEASDNASVTAGAFSATKAGSYVVTASQAATAVYSAIEKEATITVTYPATGTATVSYALSGSAATGTVTGVSTISSLSSTLTLSTLTLSGTKDGYSGAIKGCTSTKELVEDDYVDVQFTVADGYMFTPSAVTVQVNPFNATGAVKAVVKIMDAQPLVVASEVLACAKSTDNTATFASGAFTNKRFVETVHIRMYFYGPAVDKTFYIKSPISITGTVAEYAEPVGFEISTSATNGTIATSVSGVTVSSAEANDQVDIVATPSTGYQFSSWSIYETATPANTITPAASTASTSFTMPSAEVTVEATFSKIDYTVTYNAATNGSYTIKVGTADAVSANTTAQYGQTVTLAATPNTGYALSAWSVTGVTSSDNITVTNNQFTMPAENVTVSATFIEAYTLSYNKNGGSGDAMDNTVGAGSVTLRKNSYTKDGYVFIGWATSVDNAAAGTVAYLDGASYTLSANAELFAVWSPESYSFTPKEVASDEAINDSAIVVTSTGGTMVNNSGANNRLIYTTKGLAFKSSSATKVTITLDGAIKEGTIFTATLVTAGTDKARGLKLNDKLGSNIVDVNWTWTASVATEEKVFQFKVPAEHALIGEKVFQLQRSDNIFLKSLTVTNTAEPTPDYTEVRNSLTAGWYYTMCLEKAVTAVRGGSIWRVLSKAQNGSDVILEEVTGDLDAGRPYIFYATAATLEVVYTGDAVGAPVTAGNNGLVGSFSQELIEQSPNNYILYNNALYYVNSSNVYVGANRAYLDMEGVPDYSTQQEGNAPRRRVTMTVHSKDVATDVDAINGSEKPMKLMIDGQLFILRGEKMYDATGRLVK